MANIINRSMRLFSKRATLMSNILKKDAAQNVRCFSNNLYTPSQLCKISQNKLFCSCYKRELFTEGDRRFVELLNEEISAEKENQESPFSMSDGWKLSYKGSEGKLENRPNFNGDNVTVLFNLNGCVPPMPDEDPEDQSDDALRAYPDFTVQVRKANSSNVAEFECYYPAAETDEVNQNIFSVRALTMHKDNADDSTYIMETENLDPNMYSFFFSFLADRGIDNQFAEELSNLATSSEHSEFIKALESFQKFVSSK